MNSSSIQKHKFLYSTGLIFFLLYLYNKTCVFVAYAADQGTDPLSLSDGSSSGGNSWGSFFIVLAFILIVEIINFKKIPPYDNMDYRDEQGNLCKAFDVSVGVSEHKITIFQMPYPWFERTPWLDWLASNWHLIQHSLSLAGGILLFFYFQNYENKKGPNAPTKASVDTKKALTQENFKEKIEKKEFRVIKKKNNKQAEVKTDEDDIYSSSSYLQARRFGPGTGFESTPKPTSDFFRPNSPGTEAFLNSELPDTKKS